VSCYYSVLTNW